MYDFTMVQVVGESHPNVDHFRGTPSEALERLRSLSFHVNLVCVRGEDTWEGTPEEFDELFGL